MARAVDITCDVNPDVESRRVYMLTLGGFLAEGETCGAFFIGEEGAAGYVSIDVDGATDGLGLVLGDYDFGDGAITLAAGDTVTESIDALNVKLKEVADNSGGASNGFDLPLGSIEDDGDGSWSPGAVPLTNSTPVSEAVDRLNEVLAKLVPTAPADFPNGTLAIANAAGTNPRLATGVADNSDGAHGYTPGAAVNRITATGFSSGSFNDAGPGDQGTISVLVNDAVVGSRVLTGSGDNGNYAGLVISDQKDYPIAQPGFWKSIDVALNTVASPVGINKVQIDHDAAGTTNAVYFVRDALTATPVLSVPSVVQAAAGTLAYSSGVPHYGTGASLTVQASIANLAGETYYDGAPFTVSGQNGIISAQAFSYSQVGITTPIARQTLSAVVMAAVTVNVDGTNVHASGRIQGSGRNVNGASGASDLAATVVLVKRGTAGAKVDETSVPVSGLGSLPNALNAVRVSTGAGDTPAASVTAWDPTQALASHEAAVVAGVAQHDETNYATGHLPAGPDYSAGRSGAQYLTLSFKRASRSAFKINVTGAYAGCRVRLPGVSDAQPNAPGGWWDATKAYDGAGIPGETGDTEAGCASGSVMNGGSGSFTITFGTQSSTNATDNEIQVRFRLNPGQQITSLNFSN